MALGKKGSWGLDIYFPFLPSACRGAVGRKGDRQQGATCSYSFLLSWSQGTWAVPAQSSQLCLRASCLQGREGVPNLCHFHGT